MGKLGAKMLFSQAFIGGAALGALLHDHVRLEERELFEEIQRVVPADELGALS